MQNTHIADVFDELANLLEFDGANPFRIRAYRNGARVLRDLAEPVTDILADPNRKLTDLAGIGKDLAEKCAILISTGELPMLEEVRGRVPTTVLDLLKIPGLGPKKGAVLYRELGIETLDALRAACESDQIQSLKGFGAKTQQAILDGIAFASSAGDRIKWAKADVIAQSLLAHLRQCDAIEKMEMAGSYRRGKETVGDLDILVVSTDAMQVMDHLADYAEIADVLARGDTKMSIRLNNKLQVDLRVVREESFGAALQYFTGSKEHNVVLRGMAKKRGLKINEYGVFRVGESEEYLAGRSEEEIYAALDLPHFPPELREDRSEFLWAAEGALPTLVECGDLIGDLHMHTTATDGKATLAEMIAAAIERGLKYIAITDHSQRVTMAHGLDAERLLAQWKEIDRVNESLGDRLTVLKGIECDILEQGGMDLPDEILAQADWVIASIHYGQGQSREQITDRILGALANPYVSVIAHPTGRLINRRPAYEVDLDAVYASAREHRKMLELNANPARLDLHDSNCAAAKRHGVPIVISTDAHSVDGLDVLRYGVLQARRGGLTRDDIANTRPWAEMKGMLGRG